MSWVNQRLNYTDVYTIPHTCVDVGELMLWCAVVSTRKNCILSLLSFLLLNSINTYFFSLICTQHSGHVSSQVAAMRQILVSLVPWMMTKYCNSKYIHIYIYINMHIYILLDIHIHLFFEAEISLTLTFVILEKNASEFRRATFNVVSNKKNLNDGWSSRCE